MKLETIAFLNWKYPGGGGETVTHNLGCFFHDCGYRVVIYAGELFDDILTEKDRSTFTLHNVPRKPTKNIQIDGDAFCRSLREEGVDLLIVQGFTSAPFEQIRREAGCRIVFCLHSIPLWEVYAARHKRSSDIPNPTLARRLEFLLLRKPVNRLTGKIERRTLKRYAGILPHIDRLVMLCPEYRDRMRELIGRSGYSGSDAPDWKYMSIFNPLLPPATPPDRTAPKEQTVLYVGRLCYEDKRVDRLLRIWQQVERAAPGWKLQLLGRGDEMPALRQLAQRLGLERVEFMGHRTDVASYYRKASFICLTSNFEGLPMCLVEAQQYGVIPVSFDSFAAIRDITENGEAGIMVPAFNRRKYAAMLIDALHDEPRQRQLRERCFDAPGKYAIETVGRQWLELFETL